jgi:hypothetical protein
LTLKSLIKVKISLRRESYTDERNYRKNGHVKWNKHDVWSAEITQWVQRDTRDVSRAGIAQWVQRNTPGVWRTEIAHSVQRNTHGV